MLDFFKKDKMTFLLNKKISLNKNKNKSNENNNHGNFYLFDLKYSII
jgi:hypothetical protein